MVTLMRTLHISHFFCDLLEQIDHLNVRRCFLAGGVFPHGFVQLQASTTEGRMTLAIAHIEPSLHRDHVNLLAVRMLEYLGVRDGLVRTTSSVTPERLSSRYSDSQKGEGAVLKA